MPVERPHKATRGALTRQALLDAATSLFAEKGIDDTRIEEIASRAHTSVGSLYFHFGSKSGLILAYRDEAERAMGDALTSARVGPSPAQRVRRAGHAYLQFSRQWPEALRIETQPALGSDSWDGELGRQLRERNHNILLDMASDLKQAMVSGEIPAVPVDEAFVFLWGSWTGLATYAALRGSDVVSAEQLGRLLEYGLDAMGFPPSPRG